ncbi:MAG: hypothetical protein EBU18_00060 [Rhodobacteraceae bacterium]|nr:hypothetical protein [Paracoccaceae bacterium]
MSSLAGLMVFDTGAVTLSNSQVTLVDKDGFNAAGILSDGSISIANMSTNGTYDYAILIDQSYSINGVTYDATGILGLISDPAEMPTSLKTRYSGEAHAIIVQGSQVPSRELTLSSTVTGFLVEPIKPCQTDA